MLCVGPDPTFVVSDVTQNSTVSQVERELERFLLKVRFLTGTTTRHANTRTNDPSKGKRIRQLSIGPRTERS